MHFNLLFDLVNFNFRSVPVTLVVMLPLGTLHPRSAKPLDRMSLYTETEAFNRTTFQSDNLQRRVLTF